VLSALYGAVAVRRRTWYDAHPDVRRRLRQPVVSVGALAVGGSGKTPIAAHIASVLVSMGERPAVLSRGYGRVQRVDGVVVVSERGTVTCDLDRAGDEPLMLARRLAEVSVLVSEDRYPAGRLAESRLGATVHVLDDGFQHLSLRRDVDLLVLSEADVADARTLPGGRLREPLDTVSYADALVVEARDMAQAGALAERVGARDVFRFERRLAAPRDPVSSEPVEIRSGARVLAVVGIARPDTFVDALRTTGYDVVDVTRVRDHHAYSRQEVEALGARAAETGVDHVLTTEKDLVRLLPHAPFTFPLRWVPMDVSVEPADRFREWLTARLTRARATATGVTTAAETVGE
jgi:tetraacyldisaccharide 4'-kinase